MSYISNIARSAGDPKVLRTGHSSMGTADHLARGLAWFSLCLGFAELLAPGRFTSALGMPGRERLVRAFGAREIGAGIVTMSPDKHAGLWSRVAGDGMDVAALLTGLRSGNPKRANVALALSLVVGVTVLDIVAARAVAERHSRIRGGRADQYRDRSGFPQGVAAARGAAKADADSGREASEQNAAAARVS